MFFGVFYPHRWKRALRIRTARKRYRRRPGAKELLDLARLLAEAGERSAALREIQTARGLLKRSVELGKLHDELWAEAAAAEIASLERATRAGGRPEELTRLIELHRSLKDFGAAMEAAAEAERRFPDSWLVQLAVGKALYHRFIAEHAPDDGKRAADHLRKAWKLNPECARALLYLAALLAEIGLREEAVTVADALVRLVPGNERARSLRARLSGRAPSRREPARRSGSRAAGPARDLLVGLMAKLKDNGSVRAAILLEPTGEVLDRHVVEGGPFVLDGREPSVSALAKAARGAADRMGIGRLDTCTIEGDGWRIHLGEVAGATLAVMADDGFEAPAFEALSKRFSLDSVRG